MKQTFQPNSRKKHKTHGFLVRSSSVGGRAVLKARRKRGRVKLAV